MEKRKEVRRAFFFFWATRTSRDAVCSVVVVGYVFLSYRLLGRNQIETKEKANRKGRREQKSRDRGGRGVELNQG